MQCVLQVAKGELLSLLAAPGNVHGPGGSPARSPARRSSTHRRAVDEENVPPEVEEDGPEEEEQAGEDTDEDEKEEEKVHESGSDKEQGSEEDENNKVYDTESEEEEEDEEGLSFFERYAEDNARRRYRRQRATMAKAEAEEAGGRWCDETDAWSIVQPFEVLMGHACLAGAPRRRTRQPTRPGTRYANDIVASKPASID